MKFEQLIQIYWSRGFLIGGSTYPFNTNFNEFSEGKPGISFKFKLMFYKRFELNNFINDKKKRIGAVNSDMKKIYNMFIAQNVNVNNEVFELIRYNLIRLFLIKTFKGRCAALSKPSRGQRTRSNASTSFKKSQIIKHFLQQIRKNNMIEKKPEILNRKLLRKKKKVKAPKIKLVFTKVRKNIWF